MMSVGTGNNVLALPMKMTHPSRKSEGKVGEKWGKSGQKALAKTK